MNNTTKINNLMLKAMAMLQAGRNTRGDIKRKNAAIVLAKTYIDKAEALLNKEQSVKVSDTTKAQSMDEPLLPNNRQQTLKSAKNLKS